MNGQALTEGIRVRDPGRFLAALLEESPDPLTHVLGRMAGCDLSVRVVNGGERHLSAAEQHRLGAEAATACRWRHGHLVMPDGLLAASVSLVWLPQRLQEEACAALDKGEEPAGRILERWGLRREDRRALATRGMEDVMGPDVAVRASALLVVAGVKAAIASEIITREFAEMLASVPP